MSPRTRPARTDATPASVPTGLGPIAPPGKLQEENHDSAITGGTRSLSRRVLGLDVLNPELAKRPKSRSKKG